MIGDYTSDAYKEEKAFDFYDKLLFIGFTRRRTSIKAHFMRMSNGKKVEMFFTDFEKMLIEGFMQGKYISGRWGFRKAGSAYGIYMIAQV